MNSPSETIPGAVVSVDTPDLEAVFNAHYGRLSRVLARIVGDRGLAEELAVEAFLKWAAHPGAHGDAAPGWLYRTAVRIGLDELRRQTRRRRLEPLWSWGRREPETPEQLHSSTEDQRRVRVVLATLSSRDAALLVLRGDGLPYEAIAASLKLNPGSIGTFVSRAQRAFRREYVRRYGHS